jgi:hypothetical protein
MLITPATLLASKHELATLLEKTMNTKSEMEFMTTIRALYLLVDKVQQQLVSAHSACATLLEEKEALQNENALLKQWTKEKPSYVLHSLPAGTFVYRLRALTERAAADYYLCVHCYHKNVKSILQPIACNVLSCHTCQASIQIRPPLNPRS